MTKKYSPSSSLILNLSKRKTSSQCGDRKKLVVTSDQHDLIIDWQIAENQADNELTQPVTQRLLSKYQIQSISFDRGFSDKAVKALLEKDIPQVIMQKKGKRTQEEKAHESTPFFKKLKKKHYCY